jgi:hypothetical protein
MTTTDNTATTWRDLADQLTSNEIACYVRLEQEYRDRGVLNADVLLLDYARTDVEFRLADMACADVPVPAGAIGVDKWQQHIDFGLCRAVTWRELDNGDVAIDGWQKSDGTEIREIALYLDDAPTFDGPGARRLAALLIQAADELDAIG